MLRMRSVRPQPVAPSSVAAGKPRAGELEEVSAGKLRAVRCFTKQEGTTQGYNLQAGRTAPVNPCYLATHGRLLE